MKQSSCLFLLFLFTFSLLYPFSPLHAAENEETSEWTFSATPYVWFSGLNGTVGVRGHKGRIGLSFSEILSDMKISGMMEFQGRKGNQYFFFDGMYLDLSDTEQVYAAMFTDIGVKMTRLQAAWGLRVKEWESSSLDVFAGLRYWNINSGLTFRTVSVPLRHYSKTESWVDTRKVNFSKGAPVKVLVTQNGRFFAGDASAYFEPAKPFEFLGEDQL